MVTRKIGDTLQHVLDAIVAGFAASGINPNFLTFIGFAINCLAAYLFAYGYFRWAGATIVLAGIFDMTDGRVARLSKRVTAFGGFYDSVMDRYSDLCLLIGLLIYYGRINRYYLRLPGGRRHDWLGHGQLHARPRRKPDSHLQGGISGKAGARGPDHHWRAV